MEEANLSLNLFHVETLRELSFYMLSDFFYNIYINSVVGVIRRIKTALIHAYLHLIINEEGILIGVEDKEGRISKSFAN